MNTIKKEELNNWLIDNLYIAMHSFEAQDSPEFQAWADGFPKDAAQIIVNAEYGEDWEDDDREEIPEEEAKQYVGILLQRLVSNWG